MCRADDVIGRGREEREGQVRPSTPTSAMPTATLSMTLRSGASL
jgi:hypothetical protein